MNQRLELQKSREAKLDTENPRFITSLKYSIKQNYNRWKLPSFIEVVNSTTMEKAMLPVEFVAQQEVVIKETEEERRARLHPESRGNASYHPV